jgi:cyclase
MLAKRIIAALDIKEGRTVKGVQFVGLRDIGDPLALAQRYSEEGIDELVYLDISASEEGRSTFSSLVEKIAAEISIPFCVGGGIASVHDVERLISRGADKVFINSAAVRNPELLTEAAQEFGSQCIVLAVDAAERDGQWIVHTHGGKRATDRELFSWCREAADRGAGEILFTSIDHDGAKQGFACHALKKLSEMVNIPIIASGGAGTMEHFKQVFLEGKSDAALAASVFHDCEIPIVNLKRYLADNTIEVRL